MKVRMDPKTYSEQWERESSHFERKGIYKLLGDITPNEKLLEIGSGVGYATVALASSRKVLALDSNVHLVEKARSRISAANVDAEIIVTDVFSPTPESVVAIKQFAPKVIVGWFLGSNADDQDNYVSADVPLDERPKKYRENVEDAIFSESLCPPSVQWVHLAQRVGMVASASEASAKEDHKLDYDEYVFVPNGFEAVDVQIFDWETAGSTFQYGIAPNPNRLPGEVVWKVTSILAKRRTG